MDEVSFLKKIEADPLSDEPRLIYADWLSDRGDPRGAFIRAQCFLASIDDRDPRRLDLEWMERKWLAEYGATTHLAIRELAGIEAKEYHRGMVRKLDIPASLFVEHWREVVQACPWCDVRFLDVKPVWDRLVASEGLSHLAGIDLSDAHLGVRRLGQLLDRSDLSRLRRLRLGRNARSPQAIRMIARSRCLGSLQELVIDGAATDSDSLPLLATAPFALSLTRLSLAECELSDDSLEALSHADVFPRLDSLDLSSNGDLDSESWQRFFGSPRFDRLRALSLSGCRLTAADISFLSRIRQPMELRRLDLRGAEFSHRAAKSFGKSSCLRGLTDLSLELCGLDDRALETMLQQAEGRLLRSLRLSQNDLTASAAVAVTEWGGASGISLLDLSSNPLQESGVATLLEAPALGKLNRFDLRATGLRDDGAKRLIASTQFSRFTELHLTFEFLDGRGHAFSPDHKSSIARKFGSHVCHFT